MAPAVIAALVAAIIAGIVSVITAFIGSKCTIERLRREFLLEHQSEEVVRKLLMHPKCRFRTFDTISYHLKGIEPDDLSKTLIKAGASQFEN